MACSELTRKAQEVAHLAVFLAFIVRFRHDVVLLIIAFNAGQFVQGLSIRTKNPDFSLASVVFPAKTGFQL